MNQEPQKQLKEAGQALFAWLGWAFDRTADWVTQQSWKRLTVYAIMALIAAGILQDTLFSNDEDGEIRITQPGRNTHKGAEISINEKGVKVKAAENKKKKKELEEELAEEEEEEDPPPPPVVATVQPTNPATATDTGTNAAANTGANNAAAANQAQLQAALDAAKRAEDRATKAAAQAKKAAARAREAAIEANDAVELANTTVHEKVVHYRKQSSRWFMNFVLLLLIGLFATKAMMGGKKRAEAQTEQAKANAEHEALKRQVSEAKMQMMQAQVEPHFLFNTLASVEHLIETDPPRAAAMQRSLIKYLRAVLPQMRDNGLVINLGREVDLVRDYLELLKMRMEERLTVEFDVPDALRSASFPPMMLQSLTENAIKHGLECKTEGGTLKIRATLEDNKLRVSVTDDGVGFGAVKSDSTGLGLNSIRERLKLLHGNQAQLTIEANQPSGVCATIEVPYSVAQAQNQ